MFSHMSNNIPRPVLRIEKTRIDNVIELLSFVFLVACWALSLMMRWSSNEGDSDFSMVACATFVYILLGLLTKFPHRFNYPVKVTEDNAKVLYPMACRAMRIMKLGALVQFLTISTMSYFHIDIFWIPAIMFVGMICYIIAITIKMTSAKI